MVVARSGPGGLPLSFPNLAHVFLAATVGSTLVLVNVLLIFRVIWKEGRRLRAHDDDDDGARTHFDSFAFFVCGVLHDGDDTILIDGFGYLRDLTCMSMGGNERER